LTIVETFGLRHNELLSCGQGTFASVGPV
jgi:hypothetical protein